MPRKKSENMEDKKNSSACIELHIPKWNELPSIDLYLDQVVGLVNKTLSPLNFTGEEKSGEKSIILSKTMINNYVKNNLIEAPIKKKYGKMQIAKLFVICILKQVYSMNEIKELITIATTNTEIVTSYNSFCILFEKALKCTFEKKDFIDSNDNVNDNKYLLKAVLLSCCYKIYAQKSTDLKL